MNRFTPRSRQHGIQQPAGSKLARKANHGICTLRDTNIMSRALTAMFYRKRFDSGKFSIKVM